MQQRPQLIIACLFILICTTLTPTFATPSTSTRQGPWLHTIDGLQVMHLVGTPYEMGYQHGTFLKTQALQDQRAILREARLFGYTEDDLLTVWHHAQPYIPTDTLQELQGLADAANLSLDTVAIAQMVPSLVHCSVFAAWNNATTDGRLYYARSFDFPLTIHDPDTNTYIQDNFVLIIREPTNGYASLTPAYAGLIGTVGGLNTQGITTAVLSCWSNDETRNGTPMTFRQQQVLDHAATLTQASAILNTNRTEGWNFILANTTTGYAVEQTATTLYQGTWNNPTEDTTPFYHLPNIVRRTNIFINTTTAATQRDRYNPRILPLLSYLTGKSKLGYFIVPAYLPWRHYQALSTELQNTYGNLNLTSSMNVLRRIYNGTTDPVFHLFVILGFYATLNQWTACPQTGDFDIACAHGTQNAFTQPIHHYNIHDLLNYTP